MDSAQTDLNRALMLDGNAAAGILDEIFATEMTGSLIQCAHCGREGAMGTLLAFTQAPGLVLCCPACEGILLRVVQTPEATYLEMSGTAYLRLERTLAG
jgi:hypothetical protein